MPTMRYTQEMKAFIFANYKGISSKDLAEQFNAKFKTTITVNQMHWFKKNHRLASGFNACFPKGHTPANKGKKMSPEQYGKCKETMFKKGQTPFNLKPIGSERICSKDGYILVKVAEPNVWKNKQRVVWEKVNGKIPPNHVLIFLDQDKLNIDIDNLKLITKSEHLWMNRQKKYTTEPAITETNTILVRLADKTHKAKRS